MLTDLSVKGLGVVHHAEFGLRRGCIALTGETGAGKTLVVSALNLLLGDRSSREVVRTGDAAAEVEARFEVRAGHPAARLVAGLEEHPTSAHGEVEIVLARSVSVDGRSRSRVNGRMVPLATLKSVAAELVEIAGQNEHHAVAKPGTQRLILDSFAGPDAADVAGRLEKVVSEAGALRRKLDDARAAEQVRLREADVLDFEIGEIDQAAPQPGEAEALQDEARRLENAERLSTALGTAGALLTGDRAAGELIAAAVKELHTVSEVDTALPPLVERLSSMTVELNDVAADIAARMPDPDSHGLDDVRSRISVLSRLERKYGDVLAYLERARERRAALDLVDVEIERTTRELGKLDEDADRLAGQLTQLRRDAAPRLEEAVSVWLNDLALAGARVEVALTPRPLGGNGAEEVELRFAPSTSERARPIGAVASGGELARLALAFHLVDGAGVAEGGARDSGKTMLFDEVDAGVGGKAAQAVARALSNLAAHGGQVIVVTHLPQVAAHADQHLKVEKVTTSTGQSATVKEVRDEERVEELSRMLAGLPESERARGHARELLEMTGVLGP